MAWPRRPRESRLGGEPELLSQRMNVLLGRAQVLAMLVAGLSCRESDHAPAPAADPPSAPSPPDADPEAPVQVAVLPDKVIVLAADAAALYFTTRGGDARQQRDTIWRATWAGAARPLAHVDAI